MKTSTLNDDVPPVNADDVTIRAATVSDVPDIVRLLWDDKQGRRRESILREDSATYVSAFELIETDPNSQVFVATHHAAVVGCLQLTVIPGLSYRGIRRAVIEDVRVERSCRGRGVGDFLLAHAEARASGLGCKLIELFVHCERDDAHRFYERAGYTGAHRGFRKTLETN